MYTLLDGPTSLAAANQPSVSQDQVVVLAAGESYPAGLLLEVQRAESRNSADNTTSGVYSEYVRFYYQRNPHLLLSQVYKEVYKHRVFTVQRALTQSKPSAGPATVTAGAAASSSIVVPPYCGNGVILSLYTQPSLHTTSATTCDDHTGLVSVKLGKVFSCQYTLTLRCPSKGEVHHTTNGGTAHYTNDVLTPALGATSGGVNIAELTSVTSLSAALCETSDWMVAGSTCRVLSTHCVFQSSGESESTAAIHTSITTADAAATAPLAPLASPNTQEVGAVVKRLVQRIESRSFDKTSTDIERHVEVEGEASTVSSPTKASVVQGTAAAKWIEVSYKLSWEMLPVSLGAVALPPLKVINVFTCFLS